MAEGPLVIEKEIKEQYMPSTFLLQLILSQAGIGMLKNAATHVLGPTSSETSYSIFLILDNFK